MGGQLTFDHAETGSENGNETHGIGSGYSGCEVKSQWSLILCNGLAQLNKTYGIQRAIEYLRSISSADRCSQRFTGDNERNLMNQSLDLPGRHRLGAQLAQFGRQAGMLGDMDIGG